MKDKSMIFLENAHTAFLGLVDDNMPYVIPLNFVYKDGIFLFSWGKPRKENRHHEE